MKKISYLVILLIALVSCKSEHQDQGELLQIEGLQQPVEILRDQWGINHIYAHNQKDLFFAQGYAAAKDRLFQFEIWRRQATGTVAEILGERELKRDIGTRLFKFRGDMTTEMNYYHEDGSEIITAYTNGVNAYINEILKTPDALPIEFKLLNILPEKWTPEVVISRHQGLLGNIGQELSTGRAVAKVGEEKVKQLAWFHPKEPNLKLDASITAEMLNDDILELYNSYRKPVRFTEEDIVLPEYRSSQNDMAFTKNEYQAEIPKEDNMNLGSNNWVVSGSRTASGSTMMANDPHRTIAVPSLRYMVHLVAPDWNVIGGGEPEIPGISIGHNDYGTWGLTVFRTDGEDLYVYDLNPENLDQYKYQGEWVDMNIISETIKVKGQDDVTIDLKYTRHGPVTYVDKENHKAYAVRCAWLEPGGSPYLASLRMDQAKSWEEFRAACNYSHIPGENMIWADKEGNIGWQAVGIAPIRKNFSGLVPVPGDGRYEWDGYLPIIQKPNSYNPEIGFIATANENVTPQDYEHWNAIGFSWSDPYRGMRVGEVLSENESINIEEMQSLQTDYVSIPARELVPFLNAIDLESPEDVLARNYFNNWNFSLDPESIAAAIYIEWENQLWDEAERRYIPDEIKEDVYLQLTRIVGWIKEPNLIFGSPQIRDDFLKLTFTRVVDVLKDRLGNEMNNWQYGQEKNKHILIRHALGGIVKDSLANVLNHGPLPRGGSGTTPGSTGGNYNQSSGASFRIIVDTNDWDKAVATNAPGQSGDPASAFYDNLFESWAKDEYFPIYFSRDKIEKFTISKTILQPNK